jgi:hypothetical protein
MKGVNVLKWIGLGIVIWSLNLVWPEINLILTPPGVIGLILGFAAIILAYTLGYYHSRIDHNLRRYNKPKQKHSSRPSRPVPPLSMA